MARGRIEVEFVEFLQLGDTLPAGFAERELSVEGVEHDTFEEVAQREVAIFRERFQNLEKALFDANAGLDAFDDLLSGGLRFHCGTNVPRYGNLVKRENNRATPAPRSLPVAAETPPFWRDLSRQSAGIDFHKAAGFAQKAQKKKSCGWT